jgi:UDP-GlcNAc:undecaprenyl-phosphate/decaprenyl-phosphate GlcNAc-1-phosphate transferase
VDDSAYLVVIGVAGAVSFGCMPLLRKAAFRLGAVDRPDARRVHTRPTALLGGAGILAGFLAGMVTAWQMDAFADVFLTITPPLGVCLGAIAIYVVGQLDDILDVSPPAKLAGMVLAGSILTIAGVTILFFRVPFVGLYSLSPDLAAFVTVLWVVGMANAINFIDGLDGLAAGIVAIASGAMLLYSLQLVDENVIDPGNVGPLIAACVLGTCLGYLPWNVHPAKIFMGDAGALQLGLLMAAATIAIGGNTPPTVEFSGQTYFFFAPLFLPLVILGVPILDTAWAIIRRARTRSGVSIADKGHLHHRLMRLGHGQRRSVLILWTWTALLSGMVLYPTYTRRGDLFVPIGIAALALVLYTLFAPGVRSRRDEAGDDARPDDPGTAPPPPPPPPRHQVHDRVRW